MPGPTRQSSRDVHRQMLEAAQRSERGLNDWHDRSQRQMHDPDPSAANNASRGAVGSGGRGRDRPRDLNGLSRRLESLSSRLDQLSEIARNRRQAAETPRAATGRAQPDDPASRVAGSLNGIEHSGGEDEEPHRGAHDEHGGEDEDDRRAAYRPSGEAVARNRGRRARADSARGQSRIDADMASAVAQIARRQKELERRPAPERAERAERRIVDKPEDPMPAILERHFSSLAEEFASLRAEVAAANAGAQSADMAQIREIAGKIDQALGRNADAEPIETIRDDIAELRETLLTSDVGVAAEAIRSGYDGIVDRLDDLQTTVGDPALYHAIADRLGEVRSALDAMPQTGGGRSLERQVAKLAKRLDNVAGQLGELPFDTLQKQMRDVHGAVRANRSDPAIKGLEASLRALADKIEALEEQWPASHEVSDRVASLEDLIRSQPAQSDVVDRLDQLQDLFTRKNSSDAVMGLAQRIEAIDHKLDHVGSSDEDLIAALDGRLADLCSRFAAFSTQFDTFADSQTDDGLGQQIERIAERMESLAEALVNGKTLEPVRRDIADLRKHLADGDRAVVELAERIGRIADRLDCFAPFDSEDGKLAQLSEDLGTLQQQITEGDGVVFEILKRVGNLETRLAQPDAGDSGAAAEELKQEIAGIRKQLSSGDDTLNQIVERMESLLERVDGMAQEPGLLAEIAPVQKDFATLQTELAEGNRVARDVLDGLGAIDQKLTLLSQQDEPTDLARLSDEIATLRDVVAAADNASLSSLNKQIGELAERLDRIPGTGPGSEAGFDQFEKQIERLAEKLAATEDQLGGLARITERLDQIDDRLQASTAEATKFFRSAKGKAGGAVAGDDPSVLALQNDLKKLQDTAAKTDTSFNAVQQALTGIANRLTSLEGSPPGADEDPADLHDASLADAIHASDVRPTGDDHPATDAAPAAGRPAQRGKPHPAQAAPSVDDHRPLEPGSGKPAPRDRSQAAKAAHAAGKIRPGADRAEFLESARRAAKQAAAEASAKSSTSDRTKSGWLARANSLRHRKKPEIPPIAGQRRSLHSEPVVTGADKVGGSADPNEAAAPAKPGMIGRHVRSLLAGALGIAVVLVGLQVYKEFGGAGSGLTGLMGNAGVPGGGAAIAGMTGSAADPITGAAAPAASAAGTTAAQDPAFAPPTGLAGRFGETRQEPVESGLNTAPAQQADRAPEADTDPGEVAALAVPTADPHPQPPPDDAEIQPAALRAAAKNGDVLAQFEIASRYMEGRSIRQDLPNAVKWYQMAAAQGFAPAQYRLGSMFEKGLGAPKDLHAARNWYTRAAEQGNAKAIHNLAVLHAEGGLGERNFDRAAQWFQQSAAFGVTDSQYNLGILTAQGLGVERDLIASYKWFALAAKAGDADAGRKRDTIAADLTPKQKSQALMELSKWSPAPLKPATNIIPPIPEEWQNRTVASAELPAVDDLVMQAQAMLNKLGYDAGPADGRMGPHTRSAIRAFQESTSLTVTGEVDDELMTALRQTTQ